MVERFIDKEIRVLERLSNFKEGDIKIFQDNPLLCTDLKLSSEELWSIVRSYEKQELICTYDSGEIANPDEGQDATYVQVRIINKKKIFDLLGELKKKSPKRDNLIFKTKALELIARKISELDTAEGLVKFLKECGVDKELIACPNIKWRMVDDAFEYLAHSALEEDRKILFKILENICHPLMFGGDREKALGAQDYFSVCMQYDGFCMHDGKIISATDELLKEIEQRDRKRKENNVKDMCPVADEAKGFGRQKGKKSKAKKPQIFVSKDYGIYRDEKNKDRGYGIRGKRSDYLWKLKNSTQKSSDLHNNAQTLGKEITEINKNFRKKLSLKNDLMISLPAGGYGLNREKFDIKFMDTEGGC